VVLDAEALEHLHVAVVHADRQRDVELADRFAEHGAEARIEIQDAGGGVELLLRDREWIERAGGVDGLSHGILQTWRSGFGIGDSGFADHGGPLIYVTPGWQTPSFIPRIPNPALHFRITNPESRSPVTHTCRASASRSPRG